MTKLKIAPSIILFIKLFFCLVITLPSSCLYFLYVYYPLVLVFVGEDNMLIYFLVFLGIYLLHIVFVILYSFGKKMLGRIFGIGTIILLVVDIIGFISTFPNVFAMVGVFIDVVCILLIVRSLFEETKIIKNCKYIFNKSKISVDSSTNDNPYKQ